MIDKFKHQYDQVKYNPFDELNRLWYLGYRHSLEQYYILLLTLSMKKLNKRKRKAAIKSKITNSYSKPGQNV